MVSAGPSGVSPGTGAATASASVFVWNNETAAVAAAHSVDLDRWQQAFSEVLDRIAPRFTRYEPLRHAAALVQGLVSGLDRKNCWTIAEHRGAGHPGRPAAPAGPGQVGRRRGPRRPARLRGRPLRRPGRGAGRRRDRRSSRRAPTRSGTQRQYTGTAGRIENAQVAVYLTYAAPRGHALIDRALYLPRSWTDDPDRCAAAGVPDEVEFATKPALAGQMISRAVAAGVPAAWVAGDEVYGADPELRRADPQPRAGLRAAGRRQPAGAHRRRARSGSTSCPHCCPPGPGSTAPPGPAARATGSTPGPGSPCSPRPPARRHRPVSITC